MALQTLGAAAARVTWRYGAFELDPGVPPQGADAGEYLAARYDATTVAAIQARLADVFAAEGLPVRNLAAQVRRPNTFAAHRLLTAALADGPEVQHAVGDGLFRAHWVDGADVGEPEVLVAIARRAGVPEARAREALSDDRFAAAARGEERRAHEAGIHAVPTFVLGGQLTVTGAQPPAALAAAVRQALAAASA